MASPSDLAVSSECYCFDNGTAQKIIIYLLASNAGLAGQTPSQLASSAACYCYDLDTWKKVVAYLLAKSAGLA